MVRPLIFAVIVSVWSFPAWCQSLSVSFDVDPGKDTLGISPFIYGSNGQSSDDEANIRARRLGGNRMTGYNWENNASNMGSDYDASSSNDNYMTWVMGIPPSQENIPGIVLTAFHNTSDAMGCYTVLTLPAAGYVSRDKNGPVGQPEQAPSPRWRQVRFEKGSAFRLNPDTSDAWVSVDEEVNFLVNHYGGASSVHGVRGYAVDNEPALWPYSHPRLHPAHTTVAEIIAKNVAMAKAVKHVDPAAEIFGAVTYGFSEMYNLQDAPDWTTYQKFGRYVNAFLSATHDSSVAAGTRLVDVIDLHWYPDLTKPIALNDNVDSASAAERIHAPRSLWDSSYVEEGWIGQWFSPIALLPSMNTSIRKYNPGTRLSLTEFNYGGHNHISGGLAVADVLGLFGKYGVYLATHWDAIDGYILSAYKLYRNYDGKKSTFGDVSVQAGTSDKVKSSIYAAMDYDDHSRLHLVVLNKDFSRMLNATFAIAGPRNFQRAEVYGFDAANATVRSFPGVQSISENAFAYSVPPLTALHFVVTGTPSTVTQTSGVPAAFQLGQNYPNPFNPKTVVSSQYSVVSEVKIVIYDLLGREVATLVNERRAPGVYHDTFDASGLASGVYVYRMTAGSIVQSKTMVLLK
jgi:mannan endo-1,4-beta-mannosidase